MSGIAAAVTAVLSTVATTAGCVVESDGPLDFGDSHDCTGMVKDDEGRMTFLHRVATNTGSRAATITGIALIEADNIEVFDIALMPRDENGWVLGVGSGYPADHIPEDRWEERLPAVGSPIEPEQSYGVIIGLRMNEPAEPASSGGFEVEYRDESGQRYRAEITSEIQINATCPGFD